MWQWHLQPSPTPFMFHSVEHANWQLQLPQTFFPPELSPQPLFDPGFTDQLHTAFGARITVASAAAVHWLLTVRLQGRDCAADCR